ncbi:unnamed protein product [Kuraishia capsulata CBS 1993]|uniref:Protein arginine methyltransferase NDUFAF7 n=1 Tax=Kuraishia capsulata CBS 1993 TaxID=1382522 RepID=W6MNJ6_9ASCO|nr:uncharacterized protein KUCA_T00004221001 [Kuraishia capsulata CBS 1993]CDK28239.1 unnamed protein product [Kuraishia capsulata CBS 1993]
MFRLTTAVRRRAFSTKSLTLVEKKKEFVHDYSVLPSSLQYRLPENEVPIEEAKKTIRLNANVLKTVLEEGGVESLKYQKNLASFLEYPLTNSKKLSRRRERPRACKMLTRDFIEDSLYNPNYGYFSKEAEIFHPAKPFDYKNLKSQEDFMAHWLKAYDKYDHENEPSNEAKEQRITRPSLQLWHTPTELFQPYYGEALARYLLVNYKLTQYPYNDLIIYEMGGGNGTLMLNILNYIRERQPDVYARTKYKIIEISGRLAEKQKQSAIELRLKAEGGDHKDKVEIINKSIFEWKEVVSDPCFFIGLEVFDNFAHDVVKYDINTQQPHQGYVLIDQNGDMREYFSPRLDGWTEAFLTLREEGRYPVLHAPGPRLWGQHPLEKPVFYNQMKNSLNPLRAELSDSEYIPSRLLQFFLILKEKFPEHRLLASDFHSLPDSSPGYMSPVVQTMLNDRMVTTDSYMVLQGYFDIMFPTDFELMKDMYRQVVGKICKTSTHREFLEQWSDIDATTTKTGENPMLDLYVNASFMLS